MSFAFATVLAASCSSSNDKGAPTSTATSDAKSSATAKSAVSAKATAAASSSAKPAPEAATTVSASAPAEPPTAKPAASPSASAAADETEGVHALAHGVLLGVPTDRSKIPTLAEWNAAKDIKDIPGNTGDLSDCEIRAVREWLRISCRPFGGQETGTALPRVEADGIDVTEGKDGEVLTFASGGIASVVFPLLDSKRRAFTVTYGDAYPAKHIVLDWPHGAPGPTLTFSSAG